MHRDEREDGLHRTVRELRDLCLAAGAEDVAIQAHDLLVLLEGIRDADPGLGEVERVGLALELAHEPA